MRITPATRSQRQVYAASLLAVAATAAALILSGCGMSGGSGNGTSGNPIAPAGQVSGTVLGGQNPVVGATIQLYTVGTGGSGSAATALIGSTVTTGAQGQFTITGLYSCTNATQVYIVATGGNSGSGTNNNLSLAASLGSCSTLQATLPNIFIDELTTVAAAYTLAPFEGSSYTSIGTTGSSPSGLVNAFNAANALVSYGSGAVATAAAGVTLPTAEINTLGDILASCVNSAGTGSAGCNALFSATGTSDTFDAALAIAKNPGSAAVTALTSYATATAPFQPTLASAPNDFTIAYRYTGSNLQGPYGIAIDATGNAYVTNEAGFSVVAAPSPSTTFATYSNTAGGGLVGPRGISIDTSGDIWIANTEAANVIKLSPLSTVGSLANFGSIAYSSITLSGSPTDAPVAVANDNMGNAFFVDLNSNTVYKVSASTGAVAGTLTSAALANPTSIALDSAGTLHIGTTAGSLCTIPYALSAATCATQSPAQAITAVGLDAASPTNVGYVTTITGAGLTGAYGPTSGSGPVSGGGLSLPAAIAFDGTGRAWLANATSISVFNGATPISTANGYGTVSSPSGIAIDASGNVWTANTGDNSISVFIGAATPVTTPIAAYAGS